MSKIVIFRTITQEQAEELALGYEMGAQPQEDFGKFLVAEPYGTFTTIDNSAGKFKTKTFKTRFEAVKWLCGEGKDEV